MWLIFIEVLSSGVVNSALPELQGVPLVRFALTTSGLKCITGCLLQEDEIAAKGFEPMTSGLWARYATTAPYRYIYSKSKVADFI
jgi:hypothetical protein